MYGFTAKSSVATFDYLPCLLLIRCFFRHPKNQRDLKDLCGKIIAKWSRPIFHLNSEMSDLSQEERIRRDQNMADHSSAGPRAIKRKAKAEAILKAAKDLKPGDPGWIPRARVPMPGMNEYVNRPEWQSTVDMTADVGLREISACGARTAAPQKLFRTHFRTHLRFEPIAPALAHL